MILDAKNFDTALRNKLNDRILSALYKDYGTIPVEEEKIYTAVSKIKGELDNVCKGYYSEYMEESEISLHVDEKDYAKIFLRLI